MLPTTALLHGYLGFARCGPIAYFRGVESMLRRAGIVPLVPEVPAAGTVAERAEALARQLFRSDAPAFALVAHSMGGLDARYLISRLDPDRRIRSLVTVATPHRGTSLANWMLESPRLFPVLIRRIGMPGLRELTPEARAAEPIPDRADVTYASYAACRAPGEFPWFLRSFARIIALDSDGLVPVESARWGQLHGILRADHVELLGWNLGWASARTGRPFGHLGFWKQVVDQAIAAATAKAG